MTPGLLDCRRWMVTSYQFGKLKGGLGFGGRTVGSGLDVPGLGCSAVQLSGYGLSQDQTKAHCH